MSDIIDNINNLGNNVIGILSEQSVVNSIKNFSSSIYADFLKVLTNTDIRSIRDNTLFNYHIMRYNMMRKDVEKSLTRDGLGANAYYNGDSRYNSMVIPQPSYTVNHNYQNFVNENNINEQEGRMITRSTTEDGKLVNYYFDYDKDGSEENPIFEPKNIKFTGSINDSESILYKTKKLFNANKINTIISQFHTNGNIKYNGQVGSKYGESHGRNLLKKDCENGKCSSSSYKINGFDNPYCRVWTHHYNYDRLSKSMRSKDVNEKINNWGWETDKNDNKYSWRSNENQKRRQQHTSLDYTTGTPRIAPEYRGGQGKNVHTKNCMFSIENLAWKDYDPYSFEQTLSWEQRGPFGGRIMWFPPYNLSINETNNARWQSNDFIGRGEPVYTYVNSERTGTLRFTMLVDHPSSIDYASYGDNNNEYTDNDYHRYFAGCDVETIKPTPTYLTDEYKKGETKSTEVKTIPEENIINNVVNSEDDDIVNVNFYVFFPNNYSGYYDREKNTNVNPILYLLMGKGAQKDGDGIKDLLLTEDNIRNAGNGYEMKENNTLSTDNFIFGSKNKDTYVKDDTKKWYYRIDSYVKDNGYGVEGVKEKKNAIDQTLSKPESYQDKDGYGLNSSINTDLDYDGDDYYTFSEVAYVIYKLDNKPNIVDKILLNCGIENIEVYDRKNKLDYLENIFKNYTLINVKSTGTASKSGSNVGNNFLGTQRGMLIYNWIKDKFNNDDGSDESNNIPFDSSVTDSLLDETGNGVNSMNSKKNRRVLMELAFRKYEEKTETETQVNRREVVIENDSQQDSKINNNISRNQEYNVYRYDQEYHFYKHYMEDHPMVYQALREKIKYFNPMLHSMTPEGFNGRLTFLNQCVRQGSTISRSDAKENIYGTTANNLAFGRPPYCILRLGDFYYQMIIIESINYNYEVSGGLQWDLNTEGNGIQPMLCEVSINFKFIGGGDITGPVRRLQNALSFNYYANTSFYDNRADRMEYGDINYETMGGADNVNINKDKSYVYIPGMYDKK